MTKVPAIWRAGYPARTTKALAGTATEDLLPGVTFLNVADEEAEGSDNWLYFVYNDDGTEVVVTPAMIGIDGSGSYIDPDGATVGQAATIRVQDIGGELSVAFV